MNMDESHSGGEYVHKVSHFIILPVMIVSEHKKPSQI